MKNIKNIFTLSILLAVVDVAILWICKILNYINAANFSTLIKDSLSIIGILFIVGIVISFVLDLSKK
jgi:hypothetical protein